MEKLVKISLLFDAYGKLLSERQAMMIRQYYFEDLSLSEIGENYKISKQAVSDILKRTEQKLYEYENKLNFVKKFQLIQKNCNKAISAIEKYIKTDKPLNENLLLEAKTAMKKINKDELEALYDFWKFIR